METKTVKELKAYLKENGGKCSNMNKAQLVSLAKLYEQKPSENPTVAAKYEEHCQILVEKRKVFENSAHLVKTNISAFEFNSPKEFKLNQRTVNNFLTQRLVEIEEEVVQTGIEKPADKGKDLYHSNFIQVVEFCFSGNFIIFYSMIEASMVNKVRIAQVCIDSTSGDIFSSECDCEASEGGQCSHVSALLHLLLDLFANKPLKIKKSCTEQVFQIQEI